VRSHLPTAVGPFLCPLLSTYPPLYLKRKEVVPIVKCKVFCNPPPPKTPPPPPHPPPTRTRPLEEIGFDEKSLPGFLPQSSEPSLTFFFRTSRLRVGKSSPGALKFLVGFNLLCLVNLFFV